MDVLSKQNPETETPPLIKKKMSVEREISIPEAPAEQWTDESSAPISSPKPTASVEGTESSQGKTLRGRAAVFLVIGAAAVLAFFVFHFSAFHLVQRTSDALRSDPISKSALSFTWKGPVQPSSPETKVDGADELQGVILDGAQPLCLIKGTILKVGDSWEGKKITAITQRGVSFQDQEGNASFTAVKR